MATTLLDEGTFICAHHQECRDSRRAGDDFREGIMSYVGRRFDLRRDGKPLRIVIAGQESGSPKGPGSGKLRRRVTLGTRHDQILNGSGLTRRYYAEPGHPARNPHLRGTTSALRVIFGHGLCADHDGEFVQPTNGRPFHFFDGFALVNRLLCSAGPPGGSRGRPTRTMVRNCRNHFEATLSILEPTLVILQGAGVTQWTRDVLRPSQFDANEHLHEAHLGHGRLIVCTFAHPSAHGMLR